MFLINLVTVFLITDPFLELFSHLDFYILADPFPCIDP